MRRFLWDEEPGGNVEHLAEHGLSPTEWESIFENCYDEARSRSSGLPVRFGFLGTQRFLIAFYWVDESTVYPVTGYEVE